MSGPSEIYCFHCRSNQKVSNAKLEKTEFQSKKAQKPMSRDTWVAQCAVCTKPVRQFAKGVKPEPIPVPSQAPAPVPLSDPSVPSSSAEPAKKL